MSEIAVWHLEIRMRIGVSHKVMAAWRIGMRVDCSYVRPRAHSAGGRHSIAGILGYPCLICGSKCCHLLGHLGRVETRICIRHE